MKKNQNGVTLIALAVTIIVMLILAGATMSMLTGNSGIMTNAKKSSAANEEADAYEKMGQAFSAVQLSVESTAALDGGYSAQSHLDDYIDMIKSEIGSAQVEVVEKSVGDALNNDSYKTYNKKFLVWKDESDSKHKIYIVYCSKTFAVADGNNATEHTKANQYPRLKAVINFDENYVSYVKPVTSVTDANSTRSQDDIDNL